MVVISPVRQHSSHCIQTGAKADSLCFIIPFVITKSCDSTHIALLRKGAAEADTIILLSVYAFLKKLFLKQFFYIFHNIVIILRHLAAYDVGTVIFRAADNAAFELIVCRKVKIMDFHGKGGSFC